MEALAHSSQKSNHWKMDNKEYLLDLQRKITEGLKLSAKKLLEAKKKSNGKLAVYRDGKIVILNASDIE